MTGGGRVGYNRRTANIRVGFSCRREKCALIMSIPPSRKTKGFANQLAAVRGLLLPGMDQMSLANDWAESRDTVAVVLLAVFVGVLCGLAAFAFSWLINRLNLI